MRYCIAIRWSALYNQPKRRTAFEWFDWAVLTLPDRTYFVLSHKEDGMADSMFHQPVMGRRAFVGGTLAASSMAFLAACGKKGGDASGSESGSTLNFYINNPVCIDPYNVQEDQGTQVEYQLFDALTSYDAEKGEIVPLACESFEANDDATEFTLRSRRPSSTTVTTLPPSPSSSVGSVWSTPSRPSLPSTALPRSPITFLWSRAMTTCLPVTLPSSAVLLARR